VWRIEIAWSVNRWQMNREANKLAHKGAEREHEFDDQQKPFTK
jgi:hypothetical protein